MLCWRHRCGRSYSYGRSGTHSGFPGMFCSWFPEWWRKCRLPLRSRWLRTPGNSTAEAQAVQWKKGKHTFKNQLDTDLGSIQQEEHRDDTNLGHKHFHPWFLQTPTTMKGKTRPMKKKLSQFTEPAMTYAAGRAVWVKSSVVRMFVTPPAWREEAHEEQAAVAGLRDSSKKNILVPYPGLNRSWG